MFSLHETTRKHLCRWAFFLVCALPTLGTLCWTTYSLRPSREQHWQKALSAQLYAAVRIEGSQTPRPSEAHCQSVALADREDETTFLQLQDVRMRSVGDRRRLSISSAEVHAAGLSELTRTVIDWLADERGSIEVQIERAKIIDHGLGDAGDARQLAALNRLTVRLATLIADDGDEVRRLTLRAEATDDGGERAPVQTTIEHRREDGQAVIRGQFDLSAAWVPLGLLERVAPGVQSIVGGRFTGNVQIQLSDDVQSGAFAGRLENVELAELLPKGSPHRLVGVAAVDVTRLEWRDGRVERFEGELRCGNGSASRSLLVAAIEKLYCVGTGELTAEPMRRTQSNSASGVHMDESFDPLRMAPFDQLAFRFALDQRGLTLWGACELRDGEPPGCMVSAGGKPLLLQPRYTEVPMGGCVQFLTAPAASWLPATREAVEAARRLPLSTTATE